MEYCVFVFGTLKDGFPNFKTNKGVRVPGLFTTKQAYPLLLVGERYSPWMVLKQGHGYPVVGQIFTVNNAVLAEMDKLERITETDGYRRIELTVVNLETGLEQKVFAYGKPADCLNDADIRMELNGEYLLEHAALYSSRR